MLTAQDTSYDEARNLHSKWLKHQAFMAELASNKDWLNKVDQVGNALFLYVSKGYRSVLKETHYAQIQVLNLIFRYCFRSYALF